MASLNKVFLIGNLTRDPELKYTPSGMPVCDLNLAVNRKRKAPDGTWEDEAAFIDVTAWDKTAINVSEYLAKGRSVFIEGHFKLDQWDDKETGKKRSKLSVVAEKVQFLGSRNEGGQQSSGGSKPSDSPLSAEPDDESIPF